MNNVNSNVPLGSAFLGECIGTFILVWTVILTAVKKRTNSVELVAPIAIGWSVTLAHFVLVPLTGCGINPARAFGPMMIFLISGGSHISGWWVYYTAPFVGSGAAVLVCKFVFDAFEGEKDESKAPKEECAQAEASERV
jgi:glycerol uptake facilitator-like aquaporin